MFRTIRNVTVATLLAGVVAAPLAIAGMDSDSQQDDIRERAKQAQPGRENDRRSGVAGSPLMDPGSGTQGAGTATGPTGGGLTGEEGRENAPRDSGPATR